MKKMFLICTLVLCCFLLDGCTQGKSDNKTGISEEEAKTIALEHAGFESENVTFTKSETDWDNGQEYYDVEFYTKDGKEYDYEIDKYNGKILEWDAEIESR